MRISGPPEHNGSHHRRLLCSVPLGVLDNPASHGHTNTWDWYQAGMFRWEDKVHALFFARHYIRDALAHNEDIRALKMALRCYRESEQFRPLPETVPALLAAAERTGNADLAEVLKRG